MQQKEGAAFGAALQALWVLLKEKDPDLELASVTSEHLTEDLCTSTSPNKNNFSVYRDGYQRYGEAVQIVMDLYSKPTD